MRTYPKGMEYLVDGVKPEENYTLLVEFVDGKRKRFDVKPLIARGGVFTKLEDKDFFRKAHVELGTVAWDETIDIAPESLYERGEIVCAA